MSLRVPRISASSVLGLQVYTNPPNEFSLKPEFWALNLYPLIHMAKLLTVWATSPARPLTVLNESMCTYLPSCTIRCTCVRILESQRIASGIFLRNAFSPLWDRRVYWPGAHPLTRLEDQRASGDPSDTTSVIFTQGLGIEFESFCLQSKQSASWAVPTVADIHILKQTNVTAGQRR